MKFSNLKKNPILLLKALFSKDSLKFACFPLIYNLILKLSHCLLRKIRGKEDGWNASISGFLAGLLSISSRPEKSRVLWGVFLLSRSMDCIYWALINRKIIKKRWFDYIVWFSTANVLTGYAFAVEPSLVPPSMFKFY